MMEGGIQVNALGQRFSNEHAGYSEQSLAVLRQPDGVAWNIFDQRLHQLGLGFDDYRRAQKAGAVCQADTVPELADRLGLPPAQLAASVDDTYRDHTDRFGRDLGKTPPLSAPYYGVKVTGALFHTQGGLIVDSQARVLDNKGLPLPNLFAGGGSACGVSGSGVEGYLSGNGLLTAVTLAHAAGAIASA